MRVDPVPKEKKTRINPGADRMDDTKCTVSMKCVDSVIVSDESDRQK